MKPLIQSPASWQEDSQAESAFRKELFTRARPIAKVMMEPRLNGRWLEISEDGTETTVATIIRWEPPHQLVLIWQVNAQWKPDPAMKSEVDVRFTADGPDATLVELVHHKFEAMGAEAGASMRKDVDGGWPVLLERFAQEAGRE